MNIIFPYCVLLHNTPCAFAMAATINRTTMLDERPGPMPYGRSVTLKAGANRGCWNARDSLTQLGGSRFHEAAEGRNDSNDSGRTGTQRAMSQAPTAHTQLAGGRGAHTVQTSLSDRLAGRSRPLRRRGRRLARTSVIASHWISALPRLVVRHGPLRGSRNCPSCPGQRTIGALRPDPSRKPRASIQRGNPENVLL